MITDSQKSKVQMKDNQYSGNKERKEKKIDISISNHEIGFLNFLGFIAFKILVTFRSLLIRTYALALCHIIKKFVCF